MKRGLKLNVALREQLFQLIKLGFLQCWASHSEETQQMVEAGCQTDSCRQCLKRLIIL